MLSSTYINLIIKDKIFSIQQVNVTLKNNLNSFATFFIEDFCYIKK